MLIKYVLSSINGDHINVEPTKVLTARITKLEKLHEDRTRKETLRERFIKNKRPLDPTHISPKKDKQPKTRTTKRVVMMSHDDEQREIILKRQKKQEDTTMRGNVNPQ
jgi:hypothetical protein